MDNPLEDAGTEDSLDTEGCCATESLVGTLVRVVEEIAAFVTGVPRVRGSRLIPPCPKIAMDISRCRAASASSRWLATGGITSGLEVGVTATASWMTWVANESAMEWTVIGTVEAVAEEAVAEDDGPADALWGKSRSF